MLAVELVVLAGGRTSTSAIPSRASSPRRRLTRDWLNRGRVNVAILRPVMGSKVRASTPSTAPWALGMTDCSGQASLMVSTSIQLT